MTSKRHLSACCLIFWIATLVQPVGATPPSETRETDKADSPVADTSDSKRRPNIIYLMTDDQRADTLGCSGNSIIQTPNIDRLASRGVMFENAFVPTAICMTNRACVLTGQYASRHGIWRFETSFPPEQLANTYPALLREAGYTIGFIGKWGVGNPPQDLFHYNKAFGGQGHFDHKNEDGSFLHLTQIMGDQATEFLEKASDQQKPFCLSISFKAPHVQSPNRFDLYDPKLGHLYQDDTIPAPKLSDPKFFESLPDFLRESENRKRWEARFPTPEKYQESVKGYYRLISGVDVVVGRIVDELARHNLTDNTIIIFTSDHGFFLGERGFAGKWYPHELSIRVPLIVVDPRQPAEQRGTRRDQATLSIDMAPTMLDYAGVEAPESMQGKSLRRIVEGETPDWRTEFFYEHRFVHPFIPENEGVRTPQWKYIRYLHSEPLFEELYDLQADPAEAINLVQDARHTEQLEQMRLKWKEWRERAK